MRKLLAVLCAVGIVATLAVLTAQAGAAAPKVDRTIGPAAVAVLATGSPPVPGLRADDALARTVEPGRATDSTGICAGAGRGWRTTDGRAVLLEVWLCQPFQWAADRQAASLTAIRNAGGIPGPVPGIPHGVQAAVTRPLGDLPGPAAALLARRGGYLMTVRFVSTGEGLAADGEHAASIARWQWDRLPGQPGTGHVSSCSGRP